MPDYFRSIGISLKAGRTLNESDTATAEKAVVVNEAFVKDYLADVANPLGQRVYIGKMFGFEQPWRIVGVVSDARQFNLRSAPPASVFVSALQLANAEGKFQSGQRALKFVIRTTGDPLQLGAAVRQAMLEIEPNLPLTRLRSMEQIVAPSVAQERFNMSTKRHYILREARSNAEVVQIVLFVRFQESLVSGYLKATFSA